MMEEVTRRPLAGGLNQADTGRADTGRANAEPVRLFLAHLERSRFYGAPRFLGTDDRGGEVLEYAEGDVPAPPLPDWAADEELLISVACLQLELHDAAAGFLLPEGMAWTPRRLPPGARGSLVCHTDLRPENVVTRDGRAVGFTGFGLALPVDPLFDIAVAARHWIPLMDPADITDARATADLPHRFRCFSAVHGLDADRRDRVVGLLLDDLGPAPADRDRRSRDWLTAHRDELSGRG